MPYEQLIESVELCAEDKVREIKERAIHDAENIKAEAKGKDEKIKKNPETKELIPRMINNTKKNTFTMKSIIG